MERITITTSTGKRIFNLLNKERGYNYHPHRNRRDTTDSGLARIQAFLTHPSASSTINQGRKHEGNQKHQPYRLENR